MNKAISRTVAYDFSKEIGFGWMKDNPEKTIEELTSYIEIELRNKNSSAGLSRRDISAVAKNAADRIFHVLKQQKNNPRKRAMLDIS